MATPSTKIFLKKYANGVLLSSGNKVRFFPFKVKTVYTDGAILTLKTNERVYVDSLVISYSTLVTDAGTGLIVTGYIDGENCALASIQKTTLVVNIGSQAFDVGALLDKERSPQFSSANITTKSVTIKYAIGLDEG